MFRCFLILLGFIVLAFDALALNYDLGTIRSLGLPMVEISTIDSVMPTCDYVDHPDGAFGKGITNATKVPGRLVVTQLGDTLFDTGEYLKDEGGMTIKINGNTSAYSKVKPYKIKLQCKADLLMRGDSSYCDKEWRLMHDDFTLNTLVGFKVNELMDLQWTPEFMYCNVFLNGQYQGLYMLVENVKRNRDCRLDVSNTGYVIERDAYWWNEAVSFKSSFFADSRYGWTFKYPDADDVTPEQVEYIHQYICAVESSLDDGTYPDYIDIESFAAWLLGHDILGTWDSGGSNMFMTKYDDTQNSKLAMGCMWDFDSSGKVGATSWSRLHSGIDSYYEKLFASENDAFRKAYKAKWNQVKGTIGDDIVSFLDDFAHNKMANSLYDSRRYHGTYYGMFFTLVTTSVNNQKAWFGERLPWLEQKMKDISGVTDVVVPLTTVQGKTYNLQGIEVPADTRGLVIRNHCLVRQ